MTPGSTNSDAMAHAQAAQSAHASRRAARISIVGISLVILLGLLVASVAFSVLSSVQQLSEMTRQHVKMWREIGRTTTYVLGAREDRPVPAAVAEKMQARVAELLVDEAKLSAAIRTLAGQAHFLRSHLFTTDHEEEVIRTADVDREIRFQIGQFTRALPAVVSAGFSVWSSVTDLKLRSDIALKPLLEREDSLGTIKLRVIRTTWGLFSIIVVLVVSSIWIFWFHVLAPSFDRLQSVVSEGVRQARAMNHAGRQLQQREQFLRVLLDNTPGMIASLDGTFRYTSANRAYLDAAGTASTDEIIGRTVEDVLGPDGWSEIEGSLKLAMLGQSVRYETKVGLSAQQRYVQATFAPQIDSEGKPVGVVALVLDVHEQRIAREALRASEANLRATLNSIREAVIATDASGRIAQMNPAAEALTGTTYTDAAQRNLEDVVDIRETGTRKRIEKLSSWLGETTRGAGALLIARDGSEFEVNLTFSPISGAMMDLGAVVVMRDMTDENLLRRQLNQHERLTSLGQLAGGIAHDFNNLLASMRGAAELLRINERKRLSYDGAKLVEAIVTISDRAADLTERLTRFGQRTNTEFVVVSMKQVVDEVVDIVGRTIGRGIAIDVKFEAPNPFVWGDLSSLESALLNLCINGAQAMPGGGTLTILASNVDLSPEHCRKLMFDLSPGTYIEISVIDTGDGIPEKIIDRIFDPFFTTKAAGEGAGIGLAMAYGVVTDHSGLLDVTSEVHKGTKLRMLLPCSLPNGYTSQVVAAPAAVSEEAAAAGHTVLLVEDEQLLREVLQAVLETMDVEVLAASGGAEAIELYRERGDRIDLVLLDLNMPKIGGRETLMELRKIDPACRAIMMTGFADPGMLDNEHLKGMVILKKPIARDDLVEALGQALKER